MAQPSQDELRRRLKAARALRALAVPDLAARIPTESRLGERTLRKLESGEQTLLPPVLRELAVALEVPYEWFTGPDPGRLVASPERFDELAEQMTEFQAWAERAVERMLDYRTETFGRVLERLDQIDRRLAAIEPSTTELLSQLSRRTKQALAVPGADDEQETPAAGSTRDGSDATVESSEAPTRGKRRSGGQPER